VSVECCEAVDTQTHTHTHVDTQTHTHTPASRTCIRTHMEAVGEAEAICGVLVQAARAASPIALQDDAAEDDATVSGAPASLAQVCPSTLHSVRLE